MRPSRPWARPGVAWRLALVVATGSLGCTTSEDSQEARVGGHNAAPPGSLPAATIAPLEARVAQLELAAGLGSPGTAAHARAVREDARIRALEARVERLAGLEEALWRRVPISSPLPGVRLSSPYVAARFHPLRRRALPHLGVDFAAPMGTPILATADGRVAAATETPAYGLAVDLDHGNGYVTRYAHASRLLVRAGHAVRRGDTLALVGRTGLATGSHLHYEVFFRGWSVNPARLLIRAPQPDLPYDPD